MRVCLMLLLLFAVTIPKLGEASEGSTQKRLTVRDLRGIEAALGKRNLNRRYLRFLDSRYAERGTFAEYWNNRQRSRKITGAIIAGVLAPLVGIATVVGTSALAIYHGELEEENKEDGDLESALILNSVLAVIVGVLGSVATITVMVVGINLYAKGRDGMDRLRPFMPEERSGQEAKDSSNPVGRLLAERSTVPGLSIVINF
jgi:hypothetical protein